MSDRVRVVTGYRRAREIDAAAMDRADTRAEREKVVDIVVDRLLAELGGAEIGERDALGRVRVCWCPGSVVPTGGTGAYSGP